MYIKRHRVALDVSVSGGASQAFYSDYIQGGGFVEAVQYNQGTVSGISTAAHITITAERSGLTIWTATATGTPITRYPHAQAQKVSGVGLYNSTSVVDISMIPTKIPVAQERIKVEVTSAGTIVGGTNVLTGTIDLYISGV